MEISTRAGDEREVNSLSSKISTLVPGTNYRAGGLERAESEHQSPCNILQIAGVSSAESILGERKSQKQSPTVTSRRSFLFDGKGRDRRAPYLGWSSVHSGWVTSSQGAPTWLTFLHHCRRSIERCQVQERLP